MAVVQISKIQIRRDLKDASASADLPVKLAAGELAWCIDTKQLYIGTYAVGAPENQENVEILSEYSDIFSIGRYTYSPVITLAATPHYRTVQERLDDRVNAKAFNVKQNNFDDDTLAVNRAIERLFKNSLQSGGRADIRAILEFSPGVVVINDPIYIYSYTKIVGAGIGRTIFKYTGAGAAFVFVDDNNDSSNTSALNQCRHVSLRDFTLEVTNPNAIAFDMFCVRNSDFKDLELASTWVRDSGGVVSTGSIGISMRVRTAQITCRDNDFNNVIIKAFRLGINAKGDILNNGFRECRITECEVGFNFGNDPTKPSGAIDLGAQIPGEIYGPRNNIISKCVFTDIQKWGVKVYQGFGNISESNSLRFVGNNFGGDIEAAFGQIEFDVPNNLSVDDFSDRHKVLGILKSPNALTVVPYTGEVTGRGSYGNQFTNTIELSYVNGNPVQELMRFPVPISSTAVGANAGPLTCSIEIDYIYSSKTDNTTSLDYFQHRRVRKGKLTLILDSRLNPGTLSMPRVNLIDDYEYIGYGHHSGSPLNTLEDEFFYFEADLELQNNKWQATISHKYTERYPALAFNPTYETGILTYTYKILA